ncbi:MAG: DUF378 domain-containing protein [Clostridia bacterium]|nr:DUF378 domain-containing protein [Clostridia bacterium]
MLIVTLIASVLSIIATLNYLMVGIFSFNVITVLFGSASLVTDILYILFGASGLWLTFYLIYIAFRAGKNEHNAEYHEEESRYHADYRF